ncbi:MAG: NUDIX hydrolase [Acidimicrobiia bacterium]
MVALVHRLLLQLFRRLPVRARRRVVRLVAPTFTVGAMCFVERDDGRLLLVQLSYRNRWGVPGGLLKRGEAAASAAVRETREEVGLDVVLLGEPAVVVEPQARRVDVVYRARPAPGADPDRATARSPEIVRTGWFHPDALPELQAETSGALVAMARAARSPSAPVLPDALRRATGT